MPEGNAAATDNLLAEIRVCTVCAGHLPAGVRPIVQFSPTSRIVIIGQAPGSKVHASGVPWDDDSGDRLRAWMGIETDVFYDASQIALVPMGFCYPGKGTSGDLPPRIECAPLWHVRVLAALPQDRLTLLVGSFAQKYYLGAARGQSMTAMVRDHAMHAPAIFPLPHPSWRSRIWMSRNPWFETEILPKLQYKVMAALI